MKNLTKILALLLAVLLAVSLCACGETTPPEDGGEGSRSGDEPTKSEQSSGSEEPQEGLPYTVVAPKDAGVNDVIVYGSYEQDGDTSNGKEPLEWLVLKRDGNNLLVITLYAVESRVFHTERDYITWEGCSLRAWLNGEFLDTAFSSDERSAIRTTTVASQPSPDYPEIPAGNDTEDKLFLLSIQEAETLFADGNGLACSPSEALVAGGGFTQSKKPWYAKHPYACLWWLRSPGMDKLKIAYVDKGGTISVSGNQIDYDNNTCVRPAMWITVG